MKKSFLFLSILFLTSVLYAQTVSMNSSILLQQIQTELGKQKGFFALAFQDVQTGEKILWNEHHIFHAASTMKTPVMIEVYKQVNEGRLQLNDAVTVKNEFLSIVDSSAYQLNSSDDSEIDLYQQIGKRVLLSELLYQMIIASSNLATNMIIEVVGAKKVTQTMRDLGALDMQVLRGVEDGKAFAKGLNNTTTAFDLMVIFEKMAAGKLINQKACDAMIKILSDQKYNSIIPAHLPKNVTVAHKTGFITGLHHDSGIVILPDGRKYVLVILSKGLEDEKAAIEGMAKVSEMIYKYVIKN
jgi:beta-lactamase class A